MVIFNPLINAPYLEEIYGDDLSIIQIIFESFLENSIPVWGKILDAINSQNFKQVHEMTHQIKPSFSMVGLPFLHLKIQDFELYAKGNPELIELLAKYEGLSIEINEAKLVIEEELKNLSKQL